MEKVLFVTSEAHPLVKTGGLGDISGSLPVALGHLHRDVRMIMPAYRGVKEQCGPLQTVAELSLATGEVSIHAARFPGTEVVLYLVDAPQWFDRDGGPYGPVPGQDWPDNPQRFALFCRAVVDIALNQAGLDWFPDVVHCNDWQSGLIPALLSLQTVRPATIFTIHNLAYQGMFPAETFKELKLPPPLWHPGGLEFHGHLSFMKGGLIYADMLSTVSPTYAGEIRSPEYGYGLEGLLDARADRLTGILNGVDYDQWDPAHDKFLAAPFGPTDLGGKAIDKQALEQEFGLIPDAEAPLIGMVGRLAHQKGVDLVIDALPRLLEGPIRMVVLGTGDTDLEQALEAAAKAHPERIAVNIGYDEGLAHRIEAGADMFLMPSRYEPCGLNQMYSLRYGTVPIVRRTGGLADAVTDATPGNLATGQANGVLFDAPDPNALAAAVEHAVHLYQQPEVWHRIMITGMNRDFGWAASAWEYTMLYRRARELNPST